MIKEEREMKDSRDTTSLRLTTWLEYLIITRTDYSKEHKGSSLYLSEQVVSTIDNEGTEISKGNKVIVALSRNIRAEVGSGAERASVSDTSRAGGGANVSRKRSKRISSNSLSKEAGNGTILRGRKQKRSLVLGPKT